jgi:lysophospholipase L1-like esterase
MGVNGAVLSQILNDFEWRIAQFKPSVVFIMIGTNDCAKAKKISTNDFENSINEFIKKVRLVGAIPVLLTPNLIIESLFPGRELLKNYIAILSKVASEQKLIIANNWDYWSENLNLKYEKWVFKEWLNDSIHPNGYGHQQIAQLLFKSLDIFNPADPTCGGAYYEGVH